MRFGTMFGTALLLLAACGGGDTGTTTAPAAVTTNVAQTSTTVAAAYPVTVAAANGEVTITEQPRAIVSLSATATEMVAAVGGLDQLVAVDGQSDYPENVPATDLSGYTPNLEAIVAYQPDLLLVANDTDGIVASMSALGVPVLLLPAAVTFDDAYSQIELIGQATGHPAEAARLVETTRSEVDVLADSVPQFDPPLTFYHELDSFLYSATSSTFIGSVYARLGLENIADPADADGFGYPQLAAEYIIEQDPDLIFLADTECCGESALTVAQRPGWSELTAVKTNGVVELSDDIASRWGPRIVDLMRTVAEKLLALAPAP